MTGQRGRMDILPPPEEEAPPTYHEAITETGADGGPPPDLPSRPAALTPAKSVPPPRPKSLPPPRPSAPPSRGSGTSTSPAESGSGGRGADRSSRHGSTSSGEAVPNRPPPPGQGRPVAKPRSTTPVSVSPGAASASSGDVAPEDFVPIKGKKPIGIAILPLPTFPNKPSVPVPVPREKTQTDGEASQRPEPAPRRPGPTPVKPGRVPISVLMDSIPNNAVPVEQADNIENIERAEKTQSEMPPVRVLPTMPGSVSMDNIRNVSREPEAQTQPVAHTPRKRPPVKPRPMSMPPSEIKVAALSLEGAGGQSKTAEPSSGAEINKRLSGSAFALHIEDDAHALVPRELRGSKPNLAPKPNKPLKPGVKPKPILPSKPKPPAVAAKPKLKQSRSSWYADTGEPVDVSAKPTEGQRSTWYAASPAESENLMDLTSPTKNPEPLPHGPTIIRRSTSKPAVNSEASNEQPIEAEKQESNEKPGATPFDSPEKTAPVVKETKRPTIIKPLKTKTIKSITNENLLAHGTSNRPVEDSSKSSTASDKVSSNDHINTQIGTDKATAQNSQNPVSPPSESSISTASEPVSKPTILRPATLSKPKGPATAAKPLISPKSRTSHHEELSENIENEARHNLNRFSISSVEDLEGASNNNQQSECHSCSTDNKIVSKQPASVPKDCLACKNNDDEFYEHTCEKTPPKSPVKSPPKSPVKSPKLAPIGFEALMEHLHTSNIPQDSTDPKQPIPVGTSSNQPTSVQAHSPRQSNISAEESKKVLPQEKEVPDTATHLNTSVSAPQSSVPAQSSPKPEVTETESSNLQNSVKEDNANQSSKVGVVIIRPV